MATRRESAGSVPAAARERLGRAWSDQSVRLLVLAIAVAVILWLARGIIGPFIVAGMLAYAFSPVVSGVQSRTGLPRAAIIAIGYVLVLGVAAVLAFIAAERAGKELIDLSSGGRDIFSTALHKLLGNSVVIAGNSYSVDDLATQIRQAFLGLINSPSSAVQAAENAVNIGLQVVLCLIVTFYFLLDGHRFGEFALRFLDRERRADALRIAERVHVVLGRWLRGQLLLIVLVASVLYVVLGPLLHVPFALALAILSGVLEIIPLVGPVIAAALAGTATFARHGTDTTILVLAVYLIVRQVEDQVVMPLVIGRAVHLHPVVTIFAVLVGLATWGVLGGLLAVPVAAALNVTLHELYPEQTGGDAAEAARAEANASADGGAEAGGGGAAVGGAVAPEAAGPEADAGGWTDEAAPAIAERP
ncbi:MAG: AI-2E family transporter [Candidatus Limnocylindrales bacterium]|jgi:predicted PurR-regulated permease PerM